MTRKAVHIAAAGIVSPLGSGLAATEAALRANRSALAPLTIFPLLQQAPLLVGQIGEPDRPDAPLPRAHRLAREAARMAMAGCPDPPDAIVLGCTTGGILTTERLLREGERNRDAYRAHGLLSLAEDIATLCRCTGPALTVSTACSSGAVAIALALNLLRTGRMRRILAGGVDSLSRLTYFGFHSLQLVDRNGCRPLDTDRQGLAVAEGAAMLLLTTERPERPLATLLGAGFSCDAHHPTAPHPEGKGARAAMLAALKDAGLAPDAVDYINLHGTGTPDNDLAEARAIASLFPTLPPLSSIKGATGHSLAASGAIEAVVSCLAVSRGLVPGTVGCRRPDPALGYTPQKACTERPVTTVLSNSFGFGGNNGCLVIGRPGSEPPGRPPPPDDWLAIHASACLTGAGLLQPTLERLCLGLPVAGQLAPEQVAGYLPAKLVRRIKRLARLTLLLADEACADAASAERPDAVFMGTGWGALSETWDFLHRLTESAERFPSPTDFVGSVHNSPAGQVAMRYNATGANLTASGGDYSFEQALLAAQTLLPASGRPALLLGGDEGHAQFSPLLDPSVAAGALADGGGALYVNRNRERARCLTRLAFYGRGGGSDLPEQMIAALGGPATFRQRTAAVFVGVPAAQQAEGNRQLTRLFDLIGKPLPICRYREFTGEFASASAVAAVLASAFVEAGRVPGALVGGDDIVLHPGDRLLVLGTGQCLTAMEFFRP
ncbi:MAG: beta-ketoacyl-[acyl-carrier-protein] synthase family protein [Desulfobulbus sp.]|uniref:beta-ketoacyl-[acyl-carrier-protein] synthase family protein n=1 Tax=Desulfobulbus sp. TaxID=895 RepID=UPI00283CD83D|nr:beta-ketoacyl-[acyl-carrier-protein] synthase family protein [Desulfobulbus sp.]MDR2548915.1 beta-ketoacyl-[acyl-carrier-protein] synthase family protein [Desulfobulbus sp.]